MADLLNIARQFVGSSVDVLPFGNGLINATYCVTTAAEPFVLQRLNAHVFKEPDAVLSNLTAIGEHLVNKAAVLQIPRLLFTDAGRVCVTDEQDGIWRATRYIADSLSLETLDNLRQAEQLGFALGHFHRLLSDLAPGALQDTLPGFHITPDYLARYRQVSARAPSDRRDADCDAFIERWRPIADGLEEAKRHGELRLRIMHGDPKLNNFLFDASAQRVVGVIDLDTVKPGLLHYDIGDCLRSACQREDNTFAIDCAEAILSGYLPEAAAFFNDADYDYLYAAIRLIPFELGLRFYTDHLEGDVYFKVSESGHNRKRALGQFALCADIIRQEPAIQNMIASLRSLL